MLSYTSVTTDSCFSVLWTRWPMSSIVRGKIACAQFSSITGKQWARVRHVDTSSVRSARWYITASHPVGFYQVRLFFFRDSCFFIHGIFLDKSSSKMFLKIFVLGDSRRPALLNVERIFIYFFTIAHKTGECTSIIKTNLNKCTIEGWQRLNKLKNSAY